MRSKRGRESQQIVVKPRIRKRLLVITPSPERGGVEEYALTIATAAQQTGWEVHAAFPWAEKTTALADDFRAQGISYHPQQAFPIHSSFYQSFFNRFGTILARFTQALTLMKDLNPDVVLINLAAPVQCLDSILACGLLKIPTAVVFHSFPVRIGFNPYKLQLYAWARSRKQQWIGVSTYNCQKICESFGMASHQVLRIYNGTPLLSNAHLDLPVTRLQVHAAVRQELQLPPNTRLVLTVGRLDLEKGYGDLIPAIAHLAPLFPEVKFVWVGEGDHRAELTQRVQEYGIEEQVLFLGYRRDVSRLLRAADLFVFPTRFEGMPLALLEAMAHGVPIIASDVCSIPEIISHQVHGLLFGKGDRQGLQQSLHWALDNPDTMSSMAQTAQVRVQDFSEAKMIESTLITLEKISL